MVMHRLREKHMNREGEDEHLKAERSLRRNILADTLILELQP